MCLMVDYLIECFFGFVYAFVESFCLLILIGICCCLTFLIDLGDSAWMIT